MLRSPHHRLNPSSSLHYSSSPASTCSDEDSEHSQPNDLSKHSGYHTGHHGGYPGSYNHHSPHHSQQSPYIATNECRVIEYRGARIAAFLSANKNPCEYLLCLPQAFELFLKHLVGGLHTVYTKLKRLDIVPIVCNVEQVRILRGLGAIQPGVNRCKLLSTKDFDVLFKDCTTASRPGRPPKRSPVAGMVSPVPTTLTAAVPTQGNVVPYLGFPPAKKPRFGDEADFGRESPDMKHQGNSNGGNREVRESAAAAAAMLAANGYSAAFPFLQHFANASNSNSAQHQQQQQQLAAAAAALGLPGLPGLPSSRFNSSSSPSPGLPPSLSSIHGNRDNQDNRDSSNRHSNRENSTSGGNSSNNNTSSSSGNRDHDRDRSGHNNCPSNGIPGNPSDSSPADFNPTAAYLWLLSQQQQQSAAAAAALNLTGRIPGQGHVPGMNSHPGHGSLNGLNNGMASPEKQRSSVGGERSGSRDTVSSGNKEGHVSNTSSGHDRNVSNNNIMSSKHDVDESTDDEDDDIESHNSSRSENPVSSTGFNGLTRETGSSSTAVGGHHHHHSSHHSSHHTSSHAATGSTAASSPPPASSSGPGAGSSSGSEQHCLETLLRNIEGLLAIAAHNARQQQSQLHMQKELRAELASQIERERELRDQAEKQLNEEQKIRVLYQKRYKKERRYRRKLEEELQSNQKYGKENLNKDRSVIPVSSSPVTVDSGSNKKQEGHSTSQTSGQNSVTTIISGSNKASPEPASPPGEETEVDSERPESVEATD